MPEWSFHWLEPVHQGSCWHPYTYSFSMIVVISSRVNDGFSFCQLQFPLPCPVCFAYTHDVYDFKGHSLATCAVLPLLYSVRIFQPPIFTMFWGCTGGPFSSVASCWTGQSVPLIKWIFSAFGFCDNRVYGRDLSALSPTWRTRGSHLVWSLSFDLVETGAP